MSTDEATPEEIHEALVDELANGEELRAFRERLEKAKALGRVAVLAVIDGALDAVGGMLGPGGAVAAGLTKKAIQKLGEKALAELG